MKAKAGELTVDAYIYSFPKDVQQKLKKVRATIRKAAPGAVEKISYRIPAYHLNGYYLIYFAAFKSHIGMYPAPVENAEFKSDLAVYKSGKATAKFPFDKPIPFGLITRIVKFKIKEGLARAAAKKKKKKA